ncbi:hypothetical protein VULLAG_LOCUS14563 [Vulpes lagopus]
MKVLLPSCWDLCQVKALSYRPSAEGPHMAQPGARPPLGQGQWQLASTEDLGSSREPRGPNPPFWGNTERLILPKASWGTAQATVQLSFSLCPILFLSPSLPFPRHGSQEHSLINVLVQ